MIRIKNKAFAYITHGHRLLIFRHLTFPEAGIQVPAGTIKAGERPEAAVLREVFEETGLTDLTLSELLGEQTRNMADFGLNEIHYRSFYHLYCTGNPPETWQHEETDPSDGGTDPILFEFFWASLPDGVPPLIADHGKMLPQLIKKLFSESV